MAPLKFAKKRSLMNWPQDVSFAQTIQILVSVLYYICLFYCFVNWTPEAPIFRLVRFMPRFRHKIKYKIPKTRKTNMKKISKLNAKYKFPVLFVALLFLLFKPVIVFHHFFLHSAEESWNLRWRNVKREFIFIKFFLLSLIEIWKANVEILYYLVLASLNRKQPVDIYWA